MRNQFTFSSFSFAHDWQIFSISTKLLRLPTLGLLLVILPHLTLSAQSTTEAAVQLSAEVQADPPQITLNWSAHNEATSFIVYRKLKTGNSWGSVIGNLSSDVTQFVDTTVNKHVSYEYRVLKIGNNSSGYGYINAGIEVPATEGRGIILLIIEQSVVDSLSPELAQLVADLEGDGWQVRQHAVSRDADVPSVKETIVNLYNEDKVNTKAVYLLGRIPVPYSGDIYPDGHPDHEGAWPADVYYGDMNGTWTDNFVNVVVANAERHRNIPKDGKFDQSLIPTDIELQVGRVDFANMPAFAETELQLIKKYLDKSHAYKHKLFSTTRRAVVDDNFGFFSSEAFAASGWKNFGPLCGPETVIAADYFTTTMDSSYLWSYGCGGGSYTSAGGIGNTSNFAASDLQSVFTMLFGSYFGDWDATNNFLRAPLAQGKTLTNAWSGRPHWMFHHMGLGENIGYGTRLTQNNSGLYHASYGARFIHIALMGDPTLRNDVVAPVSDVVASRIGDGAEVTWQASVDDVVGYNIYVRSEQSPEYLRLNDDVIVPTTFTFPCLPEEGIHTFMVRAIVLQESPSGTYYNLSQGIADTMLSTGISEVQALSEWEIAGNQVSFTNFSNNATDYEWNFGDGNTSAEENPGHTYLDGFFSGYLIAWNTCSSDTFYFEINISTGVNSLKDDPSISVAPSPSNGLIQIKWDAGSANTIEIEVFAVDGSSVYSNGAVTNGESINLTNFSSGIYLMRINKDGQQSMKKIVLEQ